MTEASKGFDAVAVLKGTVEAITIGLGDLSLDELRALDAAERRKGAVARKGVLAAIKGEIDVRAAQLTPKSVALIARAAHDMNAAYCRALGDDSQPAWEDAPGWQIASAIAGVEFHLANPEAGPSASHDSWMAQKEAEGWKFGEVKDAEKKEHPCMVPFDKLPTEQQAKDTLFRQMVHTLGPVFNQVEALAAEVDKLAGARDREQVGPGSAAEEKKPEGDKARRALLAQAADLAFCEGDDVRFTRKVKPEDFEQGLKTVFLRPTVLRRDKPVVRIDTAVLRDEVGKPLARVRWPKTLEGGGGREALFPARSVAFDF